MASTTSTMTFTPQHSSPLARTRSPFKDPRPPPCTPAKTAKLWDDAERTAVEKERKREESLPSLQPQRCSASDISHYSAATVTTARSSFDFKFRRRQVTSPSATVAICKTCKQPITYSSGVCGTCKKTIVVSSPISGATPVVSPSTKDVGPADLQRIHRQPTPQEANMPKAISPKCKSFCPLPTQLSDPPIRLSSLRPPPGQEPVEPARSRKVSLTDPSEPFFRLQIAPTAYSRAASIPSTPTDPPTTTPSATQSRSSTRPSSISNTIAPLSPIAVHIPTHPYARHNSATPSDMSTLIPCASLTTTGRPSVGSTACSVNHTASASAWDDWESDEEGERAGLVGYWKGIGKGQGRKGRSDSKTSFESMSAKLSSAREEERKKSREQRRGSKEKEQRPRSGESGNAKKKGPRGFVRVISCGGCSAD